MTYYLQPQAPRYISAKISVLPASVPYRECYARTGFANRVFFGCLEMIFQTVFPSALHSILKSKRFTRFGKKAKNPI